jgi:DNA-binding HxlR family transcriptional regulator
MGLPLRKSKVAPPPACPFSEVLTLLRGAWTANIVWHLSRDARRFGELRHDMPRISARVLSARLRELEARGLIARHALDSSPPSAEYALTELGRELLPVIGAMARVGQKLLSEWDKHPAHEPRRPGELPAYARGG